MNVIEKLISMLLYNFFARPELAFFSQLCKTFFVNSEKSIIYHN